MNSVPVRRPRKRCRSCSPERPPLPTASLLDVPAEVLYMVLDHSCAADRLAVAATSVHLRSTCLGDPICSAVGWSILGAGATGTHWSEWKWPDSNHPKPQLVDRPVAARQGRALLDILRAVQTLADAWHGREAAKPGGLNLLAWVDHLLAAHPAGVELIEHADCRSCRHHGVSAGSVKRLWGIRVEGSLP